MILDVSSHNWPVGTEFFDFTLEALWGGAPTNFKIDLDPAQSAVPSIHACLHIHATPIILITPESVVGPVL